MVVLWMEVYVHIFQEKEKRKIRKRKYMRNEFEHERNDKGKK